MITLYKEELKKFIKNRINLSIIILFILFPILCTSFMKWQDSCHQVTFNNETMTLQNAKILSDQLRIDLVGKVDEKWFENIEKLLNKEENVYQNYEDIKQKTMNDAYYISAKTYHLWQDLLQDDTLPQYVKKDLKSLQLHYGPYENMKTYMEVFKVVALFYAFGCLYLFGQLFNQEHHVKIMDLLKSCKYGYSKLMISKIMVAISVSFILGIVIYLTLYMSATYLLQVKFNQTTAQFYEASFQIYNFQQINIQALSLMLIAGMGSSLIASCLSTLTKKTTVSLGLCATLFIFPILIEINLFSFNINSFFPSFFLDFHNRGQLMLNSWLNINGYLLPRAMTLLGVYIALSALCVVVIYVIHCKKIKGVRGWN